MQKLERLKCLCPRCHEATHPGHADIKGRGAEALEWLMQVNGWPELVADDYQAAAFAQWQKRSQRDWDLRPLAPTRLRHPAPDDVRRPRPTASRDRRRAEPVHALARGRRAWLPPAGLRVRGCPRRLRAGVGVGIFGDQLVARGLRAAIEFVRALAILRGRAATSRLPRSADPSRRRRRVRHPTSQRMGYDKIWLPNTVLNRKTSDTIRAPQRFGPATAASARGHGRSGGSHEQQKGP